MILLAFLRNQRGNTRRINPAVLSGYHPLGKGRYRQGCSSLEIQQVTRDLLIQKYLTIFQGLVRLGE